MLPHTIAKGYINKGTITGKLKGQIPAQTPKGCLYVYMSTPLEIFSIVSPIICEETFVDVSKTSSPLVNSPTESERIFPCSSEMHFASLS